MPPEFVDTHCHLDLEPLASSVAAVLERARLAGVQRCLTIGTTLEASRANVRLAHRYPQLAAAVGAHPHEAEGVDEAMLAAIDLLAADPVVVAIGEVGLDYYRQHASSVNQVRAFRDFLTLAQRRSLPLLIHCRNAYDPLLEVLKQDAQQPVHGVIHCASGPPEFIEDALQLGLHISFAGNVTFPNAQALRALVELVPDERLLLETDAPFLSPQPVRGRPNEPAYVTHTAACLAQVRGITLEALGQLTSRNAHRLFNLPLQGRPSEAPVSSCA